MPELKRYEDIGHYPSHEHSAIWKLSWRPAEPGEYSDPYIEAVSARKRTHETMWGQECLGAWRGRFDTATKECSAMIPEGDYISAPESLVKLLVTKFGADIAIWQFPDGEKIR